MLKLEISLVFIVGNAMNKIFKVIFNKSLGRMVIVSENAKSAGKTTVSGQALSVDAVEKRNSMVFALKPLLLCMSLCIGTQAWADICMLTPGFPDSLGGNNGFLPETLACGYMNSANGINSTSVGVRNSALGNYSNALGYNNTASGAYSSAVGTLNKSIGIGSSAIGSGLKQHGIETYNFGPKTLSFDNFTITTNLPDNEPTFTNDSNFTPDIITSINGVTNLSDAAKQAFVSYVKRSSSDDKINQATGIASSALGVVNNAVGLGSSAVGFNNNATGDASAAYGASTSALAQYSSVFGSYSQATAEKATAVGYNSVADRANTISVGKSGAEKQITNVAAGSQSTDAVNKKQMDDSVGVVDSRITTEVGTLDGKITANSNAITGLDGRVTTNEGDIANLQQGQGTLNQLAVQYDTATQDVITLKGTTGTKITNLKNGDISTVSSKDAVTGGQLFTTNTAISTLDGRVTTEVGTLNTRIGTEVTTLDGRITSEVGTLDGKITTNSTAISGLDGRVTTEVGTLNTRIGTEVTTLDGRITSEVGTLDGKITTNSTAISGLDGRVTTNEGDIANLKSGQGTLNQLAVQYDTTTQDVITLKGTSGTKITNLQNGDISTVNSKDAVTGGQLYTTNTAISTLDGRVTTEIGTLNTRIGTEVTTLDGRITSEIGTLDGKITTNSTAISGLDGRVTTNEGDIANLQQGQGTLNQLAVQYDSATQDVITLKGANGTTLTNLKAGDISTANSKDAVTGGQLYTTNQNVTMLSTQAMADSQQITSILGGGASYSRGVFTLPTFSIQGKSYSNIGDTFGAVNTEISSLKTSVTNLKAYVDQQNSGSEGNLKNYIDQQDSKNLTDAKNYTDQQASNTLNNANKYTDQQASTTLDSANQYSDQQAATALKNANAYTDHKVTGINTGTGNTKGTGLNSTAIGPNTVVSGNNSTAVGVGNNVSGNNSGAFGDPNIVTANGSYVVGNDNTVSGDNTFVLGNNVNTSAKNSVVLGNDSTSTRDNTVSVGSTGNERQITNVADATEKTDAVNLRQMQAANTETLKSSKEYTETRVSTLESSFSDFSYQTDRRFKEVDKRFDRQGAMSAAMMNMATSTAGLKGLNRVGVAAGFQGDEKAVAIGYQRIVSENVSLSVGGAFTDEDGSGGAGVGFSW